VCGGKIQSNTTHQLPYFCLSLLSSCSFPLFFLFFSAVSDSDEECLPWKHTSITSSTVLPVNTHHMHVHRSQGCPNSCRHGYLLCRCFLECLSLLVLSSEEEEEELLKVRICFRRSEECPLSPPNTEQKPGSSPAYVT